MLDVGCGEGQVSRYIARGGAHVVGLDPTPSQIREAHGRGGPPQFVQAKAEQLPFGDGTFGAVILCLAIEHIDPFEPAIEEIARVLEPDGQFLLLLVHPLLQAPGSGWVDEGESGEAYWRVGSYLPDDFVIDEVEPGIYLPFNHRPLSRYVHAMGVSRTAPRGHGRAFTASGGPPRDGGLRRRRRHPPIDGVERPANLLNRRARGAPPAEGDAAIRYSLGRLHIGLFGIRSQHR